MPLNRWSIEKSATQQRRSKFCYVTVTIHILLRCGRCTKMNAAFTWWWSFCAGENSWTICYSEKVLPSEKQPRLFMWLLVWFNIYMKMGSFIVTWSLQIYYTPNQAVIRPLYVSVILDLPSNFERRMAYWWLLVTRPISLLQKYSRGKATTQPVIFGLSVSYCISCYQGN